MPGIKIKALALLLFSAFALSVKADWHHGEVRVCAEDAGWPPFSFPPNEELESFRGFNADLLKSVFDKHAIPYSVVIRPWKRCLLDGKGGDVHIVLDAARNSEREQSYLLTNPIYQLTPAFFFAAKNAQKYTTPVAASELNTLFVCGQKGYIYNNFGFEEDKVSAISKGLHKVLDLARLERCDIGLARKEILMTELKNFEYPEQIAHQTLLETEPEKFYWMINRSADFASELKAIIDEEVGELQKSGAADAMLQVYLN